MSAENLSKLLDALTDTSVYVIEEKTHRLLYFNKRCRDTGRGRAALGVKCHEVWPEACANCPLDSLGDAPFNRIVCFDPLLKTTVDISANRILWDGLTEAVVVTATPHRLNFEEEQGLQKIEKMYANSLVTVFDECVIVDLTNDYFVNCQKNGSWSNIPEQGNYEQGNHYYSGKKLHPDDMALFLETFSRHALLRIFSNGEKAHVTRRLRALGAGGSYRMMEFTAARLEDLGENECWCVLITRDIQEEYLQEQLRSMEMSRLATAAQFAYQMLISVNLTQNTYHMVEYTRFPVSQPESFGCFDDLIAAELATVHPDYQEEFIGKFSRQSLIDAYTGGQRIVSMEVPHYGADGAYHWNFTQVVHVESPDSSDILEITLSRNIDEKHRMQEEALEKERRAKELLEEALLKAEKASRAKSDFLSKMSHDIRTPMNAIVGMTELAQLHLGEEDRLRDYLQKIAGAGAHLLGLVNEVLDVNKIESGTARLEETDFSLYTLMEETVEMVRLPVERKHQKLTVRISEDLDPQVFGDARRIKQVLVNILENASKYTPEGGCILFRLAELEQEGPGTGTYRFFVEDDGIGMTPEYQAHIFEPFSRADDSRISTITGTGLGMTIVKNLVTMMGGEIRVESEYGRGSRFTVTLCLAKGTAAGSPDASESPAANEAFSELRILLAEDNELNRQIAVEMLELLGAAVETAQNGREAVEAVRSHPPLYYDMIFMDIQMPMMNGYEAAYEIRRLGMERISELPIVAMTADAFTEDKKRARLAGMNGHLAKPISIEQLRHALSDCLSWKRQHRPEELPPLQS